MEEGIGAGLGALGRGLVFGFGLGFWVGFGFGFWTGAGAGAWVGVGSAFSFSSCPSSEWELSEKDITSESDSAAAAAVATATAGLNVTRLRFAGAGVGVLGLTITRFGLVGTPAAAAAVLGCTKNAKRDCCPSICLTIFPLFVFDGSNQWLLYKSKVWLFLLFYVREGVNSCVF